MTSSHADSDDIDVLKENFEQICHSNELLMNENLLLKTALDRIPPEQLVAKPQQQRQRYGRNREKEKQLTISQKNTLARNEIELLETSIAERKKEVESLIESAKASIDVFQAQLADIQKESFQFRRNVAVEGLDERTHVVKSERVKQYFESVYKEKCTLLGALKLKYDAMKQKHKRATQYDAQNKEAGESLEEIDYEQLKIENKLFQEKIAQRTKEMMTFKLTSVSTQQTLNKKKRELAQEKKNKEWLTKEIDSKKTSLIKIEEELQKATKERDQQLNYNKILKARHQEGEQPRVLDSINQKVLIGDMEKAVQTWERKVEIAEKQAALDRAKASREESLYSSITSSHPTTARRGMGASQRMMQSSMRKSAGNSTARSSIKSNTQRRGKP
ncbi:putative flagellar associated protein [Blattamonas nauphoetae]|uniref:Cilia- and flagella-associated protein 263 n=1 Tax=Blattamonas nauphoetae TaxID=2049346 RepID=A0ABQ9YEN1_9EUKA|nr:putative flagellar associated protein [Blattamonas nauphoetae]